MKNVIIRIAAFFAGAVLLWGCSGEFGPTSERIPIEFRAGTALLLDDDTRTATLHPSSFEVNDNFSVFALFNDNGSDPVFDGATVTFNGSSWSYLSSTSAKNWTWNQAEDRYDFIGISPVSAGASRLVGAPGRLTVTTDYDITSDNYDLMAAVYTRSGETSVEERTAVVPMSFKHMLTAVAVHVINISSTGNFKLNYYRFKNITNQATLKTTLTSAGRESYLWIDAETSSSPVRQEEPATGAHNPVAPGDTLKGGYNLVIPQRLNEGVNLPALEISYTYTPSGGVETTATPPPIELRNILLKTNNSPIVEWQMGVAYTYEISIRLDGGVEVRVVTTQWDEQIYETPGIMIPVD